MSPSESGNLAASIRQRLLNAARSGRQEFQHVLMRYGLERLLYRISRSEFRDTLILKGAMLFRVWSGEIHRPTQDLDLLGFGPASVKRFEDMFRTLCRLKVEPDGLTFDPASIRCEEIRDAAEYDGLRLRLTALLGTATIPLQVDIGFGDVVTPAADETEFPTLLDLPRPIVRSYPRETVIAEKLQAMVMLGIANSRMKDFFDVWMLARMFEFQGELLCRAIAATFERRATVIPNATPFPFTAGFHEDRSKRTQWTAFLRKGSFTEPSANLTDIVEFISAFLLPPLEALRESRQFAAHWPAGGPWQS